MAMLRAFGIGVSGGGGGGGGGGFDSQADEGSETSSSAEENEEEDQGDKGDEGDEGDGGGGVKAMETVYADDDNADGNAAVRAYVKSGMRGPPPQEVLDRFEFDADAAILMAEEMTGYSDQDKQQIHDDMIHPSKYVRKQAAPKTVQDFRPHIRPRPQRAEQHTRSVLLGRRRSTLASSDLWRVWHDRHDQKGVWVRPGEKPVGPHLQIYFFRIEFVSDRRDTSRK
jgi:hypothetical protein